MNIRHKLLTIAFAVVFIITFGLNTHQVVAKAPARLKTIFDPFVQDQSVSPKGGTGLGLSICKTFAELMDGSIEVESELGKGTRFRVRMPAGIKSKLTQTSKQSRYDALWNSFRIKKLELTI